MDKPGAPQSLVVGGHIAPPSGDPDALAIDMMNDILGGDFVSRINLNIREDKHWSYGAMSAIPPARGPRPFVVLAPVQSDKTKETMEEIRKELEGILGPKPVTPDEFANAKNSKVLGMPGRWETMGAIETVADPRSSSSACPTTISRSTRAGSPACGSRTSPRPRRRPSSPTAWSGSSSATGA